MRNLVRAVMAGLLVSFAAGCATPDSVKLQGDKVDRLQRQIDDLQRKIEKTEASKPKPQP